MTIPTRPTGLSLYWRLRYRAEAALFFAFMGIFRLLSVDAASALGGFIGRHLLAHTPIDARAQRNLEAAYPDKSPAELAAIRKEMWDNLGRTIAEYPHLDAFRMRGDQPRILVDGLEHVRWAQQTGKGIIFLSGHFANWEILPITAADYGLDGGMVYRPVNNPYVDAWTVAQRTRNGPKQCISKGVQGTRRIFSLLRQAKAIFILVDQKTNEGIPAQFFGRVAMTTPAPAVLALKVGAVLLPTTNERVDGAHFRVTVHPPIIPVASDDHDRDVLNLTQQINDVIEAVVRKRPSQWLWIHRRWPKAGDQPRSRRGRTAQALGGNGVGVDSDGSSLT
ncbi:MAG: lysophospholipid acyltransferase family protein [Alphaproteobacteria bacterium]|nr:lysophospholipid acyltransferase family protein [Alphaproteobacteria bacterium]